MAWRNILERRKSINIRKVLILGSSGQVGSHLTEYCNSNGIQTLLFDIVRNSEEDLRKSDHDLLLELMLQADLIFFLAFDVGGSHYLEKYQNTPEFIQNNLRIMSNTFHAIEKSGRPFIFASSQMSNMLGSNYGILKLIGERLTKSLNGLTVHFWNVYGYESNLAKSHVITDFVRMAITENVIRMRTDGNEERDFLYADDASEALITIANRYSEIPKNVELHIASFTWNKISTIARIIAQSHDAQVIPSKKTDLLQNSVRNPPSPYILQFWQPKTNLEDGIQKVSSLIKRELDVKS
jgi:nucleoside-diphosphate-sugar epimerase